MKKFTQCIIIVLVSLTFTNHVIANSSSKNEPTNDNSERIVNFAKKIERILASKGARIAIVGRIGRPKDELPEGIYFTHAGFAVYSKIQTAEGKIIPGYAMYNLYQRNGEPNASDLVQDYPVDFFAGVQEFKAGVIIPSPELQKRLLKVITSPTYKNLHNSKYSAISNPFNTKYQNCTEHTLDVLIAAIYDTNDLNTIKANERAYFDPQRVHVNPFKLLFGSIFISDIAISDHPDLVKKATFTTIANFLNSYNAASDVMIVDENSTASL